jgi:hypothetical protein
VRRRNTAIAEISARPGLKGFRPEAAAFASDFNHAGYSSDAGYARLMAI